MPKTDLSFLNEETQPEQQQAQPTDLSFLGQEEKKPGATDLSPVLQKAAQIIEMPMRGIRGIGVGAERLIGGDTLAQAMQRASAATQQGYQMQPGEKIGAIGGEIIGSAPLYTVLGEFMPAAAATRLGPVATGVATGGATGLAGNLISQEADNGAVSLKQAAGPTALGAILGGAAGKIGDIIAKRAAARVPSVVPEAEVPTVSELPPQEIPSQAVVEPSKPVPLAPQEAPAASEAPLPNVEAPKEVSKMPPALPTDEGPVQNPVPIIEQTVKDTEKLVEDFKAKAPEIIETDPSKVIAYNRGKQITDIMVDMIKDGKISPEEGARLFNVEYAPGEAADIIAGRLRGISTLAGQELNRFAQAAREFMRIAGQKSDIADELARLSKESQNMTLMGKLLQPFSGVTTDLIQGWRSFLTTQIGTTARNVLSQAGRVGVGIIDDGINGAFRFATGKEPLKAAASNAFEDVMSIFRRFSPNQRAKLEELLNKYPVEKLAIQSTPMSDLIMNAKTPVGKVLAPFGRMLNVLNTTQEGFFRRIAFDARLRSNLTRLGLTMEDLPKLRPQAAKKLMDDAIQHALEMTFATNPEKGSAGAAVLEVYRKVPILNILANPFPRFWMNAMNFTKEFGPWGIAFSRFGHENPEVAFRGASRAMTGSMMFAAALAMRGKYGGEKWYEIKPDPDGNPNRVIDTRNFNPFSMHLFIADFMKRYLDMKSGKREDIGYSPADIANAVIALRRSDFAGVPFLDNFVFSKNEITEHPEKFMQVMTRMVGDFVGGFATPIKSFRDLYSGFNANQTIKDTKQSPLLGPTVDALPGLRDEYLKDMPATFRPGPAQRQEVGKKQLPGISYKTKTNVERELDRLDVSQSDFKMRSSSPEFDNAVGQQFGPLADKAMSQVFAQANYKALPYYKQQFVAGIVLKEIHKAAIELAKGLNVDLNMPLMLRQIANELPKKEAKNVNAIADDMDKKNRKNTLP